MDVLFIGHIEGVKYTDTAVFVTASERRQGYKKKDGTVVHEELLTFRFLFKPYFRKYISEHFGSGMLVKIKGQMLPYAKDHQGNIVEGFSLLGQTIDLFAYPSNNLRLEKKRIRESMAHTDEAPDLEGYQQADF